MTPFDNPSATLGSLDAQTAGLLLAQAAEITLVLDADGRVIDRAINGQQLEGEGCDDWLGRLWSDTVTVESRPKIESLLEDALGGKPGRQRQVNHPSPRGQDLPVTYSAASLPGNARGRVIVFGRDMRPAAVLQQRVVNAQQAMERDYWRLRDAETRYRLLFQLASEAVLIVEASNQRIVDANPAANLLLGKSAKRIIGQSFPEVFAPDSRDAVASLLAAVRVTGRVDDVINVSGHRLGTAEVESALVAHETVAKAAVVGFPHDIKGQGIYAYVTLMKGVEPSESLRKDLEAWVRQEIGPIARPDLIQWAPGLPKTRSGKIMRRILRKIAENDFAALGDTSTLADPAVVEDLIANRMNRG